MYKDLEIINGVKFTKKEIDVLSYLFAGKSIKATAADLGGSPRTIEYHVQNIKLKLQCNSRDEIINFIEQSNESSIVREHYQNLALTAFFEKSLKKVSVLVKNTPLVCRIVYDSLLNKSNFILIHELEKHLKLVGFNVEIFSYEKYVSVAQSSSSDNYILYVLSNERGLGEMEVYHKKLDPTRVFFLYLKSDESYGDAVRNLFHANIINFKGCDNNYYFGVFEILKKLLPLIDLAKIIWDFGSHYIILSKDLLETRLQKTSSSQVSLTYAKHQSLPDLYRSASATKFSTNHILSFMKTKTARWAALCILILIIVCSVLFLVVKKSNPINNLILSDVRAVRSDLLVPNDVVFLKRSQIIKQVTKKFKEKSPIKVIAFVGVGGSGKTTLARDFGKSCSAPVVWEINAETRESLMHSFNKLAYALSKTAEQKEEIILIEKMQDVEEKEKQLLIFVQKQLKEQSSWLLIYDNVESFSDLKQSFPQDANVWGAGKVIITTRDSNILNSVKANNVIQVDQLNPEEAITLFIRILYNGDPNIIPAEQGAKILNKARAFLTKIPPFPLDVSIAAYYIKNVGITFDQYLEKIKKIDRDFDKNQQIFLREVSDYTQTRYSIITSSLDKLIENNPEYKDLLLFVCLLDSQDIPKCLFEFYTRPLSLDYFLHDLKKYSLITSISDDGVFCLHRSMQMLSQKFILSKLTEKDKGELISNYIEAIQRFYEHYVKNDYKRVSSLIPHLEAFLRNIERVSLAEKDKEMSIQKIKYILGNVHYKCARNPVKEREYFMAVRDMQNSTKILSDFDLAWLLRNLANICINLESTDEAIRYAKESLEFCKIIPQSDVLAFDNSRLIGYAYIHQNDFDNANKYLLDALQKTSSFDLELKKESEAIINGFFGILYSTKYINGTEANKGVQYADKALSAHKSDQKLKKKLSCNIVRNNITLGKIYCRLGKYQEAINYFKEAQFIIDKSFDNCPHNFSKVWLKIDMGEIDIRNGDLSAAKDKLIEAIQKAEKLTSKRNSALIVEPRIFYIEAQIRLGELAEAYNDCLSVLQTKPALHTNYSDLIFLTGHYHAAVIKYKQKDFKKSWEYFEEFFNKMKPLCKEIMNERNYNDLESEKVFEIIPYQDTAGLDVIKKCFQQSAGIFSALYGKDHPFVRDYVLVNNNECNRA